MKRVHQGATQYITKLHILIVSLQIFCKRLISRFYFLLGGTLTKCQDQRERAVQNSVPGSFIPRCKEDGNFEEIQCQGSVCYCVDDDGNEVFGTKTNLPDSPNCFVAMPKQLGKITVFTYIVRNPNQDTDLRFQASELV